MLKLVLLVALVVCSLGLPTEVRKPTNVTQPETKKTDLAKEYVRVTVDQTMCPNRCSGRGRCVHNTSPNAPPENTTICVCDQGWTGDDCSAVMLPPERQVDGLNCPNNCSSHGVCYRGSSVILPRCYCDPQYTGLDCSTLRQDVAQCPNNCSGFGVCTEGYSHRYQSVMAICMCDTNHRGEDCSEELPNVCPHGCSGQGTCTSQRCVCNQGFIGTDCSLIEIPVCPNNCSSHGRCLKGLCYCFPGFSGDDCSEVPNPKCLNDCSGHGRCMAPSDYFPGGCRCHDGWKGEDCSQEFNAENVTCLMDCSGRGACVRGECQCAVGFRGKGCEFLAPVGEQQLPTGEQIHPYYMESKLTKQDPGDRTRLVTTKEHPSCANNCSSHGVCTEIITDSVSLHHPETGEKMDLVASAPTGTQVKMFICKCDEGWIGEDCSRGPPRNLGKAPSTSVEADKAPAAPAKLSDKPLFTEDTTDWEHLPSKEQLALKKLGCVHNCSSRGRCVRDKLGVPQCSCYAGWSGKDCSLKIKETATCGLDCSGNGRCAIATSYFPMRCVCDKGFTGENCEKREQVKVIFDVDQGFCPNHCSYRGSCIDGKCVCLELGFGGPDCSLPAGGQCEANCNGNGICFWGTCNCLGGYSGDLCDVPPAAPCPNSCHMRGKCVGGQCQCLTGFTGDDCSDILIKCPRHCSGHGECIDARVDEMVPASCQCDDGWTGFDCSNFPMSAPVPVPESEPTRTQQAAGLSAEPNQP